MSLDKAPVSNCQDQALFNIGYIERIGFEGLVVHGKLNGVWHVQTKYFDGNKWRWLLFTGRIPVAVDHIDGWGEFIDEYDKYKYLEMMGRWARSNNFYQ